MGLKPITFLLRGGLNLVSPPVAIEAGTVIAGINYESVVGGYERTGGIERYSGMPRPSDSSDPIVIAARRAAITAVPGIGMVRGVQVYAGHLYAFRDVDGSIGGMYMDSAAGWVLQTFGTLIYFQTGTAEFIEGENLVGGTSGATATIERVVIGSGAFDIGDAAGYLILSNVTGTFVGLEALTSSSGAAQSTTVSSIGLQAGGIYDFTKHNFYGSAFVPCMYFANGLQTGFEWDGEVLTPIHTGTVSGSGVTAPHLLARSGGRIITRTGAPIIVRTSYDNPKWVSHYKNHLFWGYTSGAVINSGTGLPLDYRAVTGAAELSFGDEVTGLLTSAATSIMIFGRNRIEYVTGNDANDFNMLPVTDSSGAAPYSVQMAKGPTYLDDGGVRSLDTTASFGDWTLGTATQAVEPLIRLKRESGITVAATMIVKAKSQYRMYWNDGSGLTLFYGRTVPEPMTFKLPIEVTCACAGELSSGAGDRLFVGAADGFVYEVDRGRSFDGAVIQAFIRVAFNSIGSPAYNKVIHGMFTEVSSPGEIVLGVKCDVDYSLGTGSALDERTVDDGSPFVTTDLYGSIDFTQPVAGVLHNDIGAFGSNMAVTYVSDNDEELPHILQSVTINYAQRGLKR